MENNYAMFIECPCKRKVAPRDILAHIVSCKDFSQIFGDLGSRLAHYVRIVTMPDHRKLLGLIFSQISHEMLPAPPPPVYEVPPPHPIPVPAPIPAPYRMPVPVNVAFHPQVQPSVPPNAVEPISKPKSPAVRPPPVISNPEQNCIMCVYCKTYREDYCGMYLPDCMHAYCIECLKKYAFKELPEKGEVKCQACQLTFSERDLKQIMGADVYSKNYDKYLPKLLLSLNLIECKACKTQFSLQPGKIDLAVKDEKGHPLTKEAAEHMSKFRARCPKEGCNKVFCGGCSAEPYHIGMTCEDYKKLISSRRCRFCKEVITVSQSVSSAAAFKNVCNKEDCKTRMEKACDKILPCGHCCYGYRGESHCLPCLNEECVKKNQGPTNGTKEDDYCNICFTSGLGDEPCVMLDCRHIFHVDCVINKLKKRWPSPRITFGFAQCSLCKKWISSPLHPVIGPEMKVIMELYELIKGKAMERAKMDGIDKDPKLKDPNFELFGKLEEFVIKTLCYYMCYKCKKPYFGGLKDCRRNMDEGASDFKESDLVCGGCASVKILGGVTECKKHGREFIEYKCRFCCSVAQWFCWDTTHFCEPCHARQCKGEYVNKIPKDKLPKCTGPETCPLRIKHPGNGEEYSLGCAMCRDYGQGKK